MRRSLLGVALGVAIALVPATASAQTRDEARARRLFDAAMTAMDDGQYDVAIDTFTESLALAPRPATAFNLALALHGAGRLREAIARLDALLADPDGRLRPEQRREAAQLREGALAELATLRVRVTGAEEIELRIDGVRAEGAAPDAWFETSVDPGEHVITASARDHVTVERRVSLARSSATELPLGLQPATDTRPGVLVVESTDPTLMVEIEGVASERGSIRRELPPGEYVVRVIASGDRRDSRIEVPPGRTVRLSLEPPESSASLAEQPWFWATLGGVALVVAGVAVGVGLALDTQRAAPITDPIFPVIETLTW